MELQYLRRCRQRSTNPQVPNRSIRDLGQILGNLDFDSTDRLRDPVDDLDLLVKGYGVEVAHGVAIQPHAIVITRILVQWVRTVCSGLTVEAKVNSLTSYHCRVVRDALVDVDTGVVTLAPCCVLGG